MAKSAVIREFMIIGEAAAQLPEDARARHPSIPWREFIHLRNFYIHVYHAINYRRVWRAARSRIPTIEKAVSEILSPEDTE